MSEKDKIIEDAQDIEALIQTRGWQLLKGWLEEQVEIEKRKLETCPLDEVLSVRKKIKAYQSILNKPEEMINEANLIKEEK